MNNKKNNIFQKSYYYFFHLASMFALLISTIAINQRCWYIMHEEPLPDDINKLKK